MGRVLICTSFDDVGEFGQWLASRLLLAGLDEQGLEWELHQPWLPRPDLASFDVVLSWSYRQHFNNYVFWAKRFERRARELGLPVINTVEGCDTHHSYNLRRWAEAGVPCARFQRFRRFEDIELSYPLIIRVDGRHRGRDMYLTYSPAEARALVEWRIEAFKSRPIGVPRPRMLDLAIEFVESKGVDELYRKYRVYVVGDRILPRQLSLTTGWKVNLWSCEVSEQSSVEDRRFREQGPPDPELVRRAARALCSDVIALDFSVLRDGSTIFWEGNRHFNMTGDDDYQSSKLHDATGRSEEERAQDDRLLGRMMGELVAERIAARRVA